MEKHKESKKPTFIRYTIIHLTVITMVISFLIFNTITRCIPDINRLLVSILFSLIALLFLRFRSWQEFVHIIRPKLTIKMYSKEVENAWEYVKNADERYQQRVNYLLVAESMLLFSFVTIHTIKNICDQQNNVSSAIAIIGILITLSWFFVNLRLGWQVTTIQKKYLLKHEPVYWDFTKSVQPQPTAVLFLSNVIPSSIFLLWIYLFYFSINTNSYDFLINILPFYILLITGLKLLIEGYLPDRNTEMPAVSINITLPEETFDKLKEICKDEDRTCSNFIKRLIESYKKD